jgi:hypothetical protein
MLQSHETVRHYNSSKAFISDPPYVAQALLAAVSVPVTVQVTYRLALHGALWHAAGGPVGAFHQLGPRNGSAPRFSRWTHLTPALAPRTRVCAPRRHQRGRRSSGAV